MHAITHSSDSSLEQRKYITSQKKKSFYIFRFRALRVTLARPSLSWVLCLRAPPALCLLFVLWSFTRVTRTTTMCGQCVASCGKRGTEEAFDE